MPGKKSVVAIAGVVSPMPMLGAFMAACLKSSAKKRRLESTKPSSDPLEAEAWPNE
jgi:hypothetical protein